MQAYKLKGTIDQNGQLVINEPLAIAPGKVEIIILQSVEAQSVESLAETGAAINSIVESPKKPVSRVKAFRELLENAPPVPPDFDADQAKWEYLKEKHNL